MKRIEKLFVNLFESCLTSFVLIVEESSKNKREIT